MAEENESILNAGQENTNHPDGNGEGTESILDVEAPAEDAQAETAAAEETKVETTDEVKPTEEEAAKTADESKEAEAPKGAPEKYEDFKVPEGVEEADGLLDDFKTTAKELNLPQESAQKLVDTYFKVNMTAMKATTDAMETQSAEWMQMVKSDPDMGGEHFNETLKNISLVKQNIPQFDQVTKLLGDWGGGNHPAIVSAFNAVGKLFAEDKFISAQNSSGVQRTPEQILYPDLN